MILYPTELFFVFSIVLHIWYSSECCIWKPRSFCYFVLFGQRGFNHTWFWLHMILTTHNMHTIFLKDFPLNFRFHTICITEFLCVLWQRCDINVMHVLGRWLRIIKSLLPGSFICPNIYYVSSTSGFTVAW